MEIGSRAAKIQDQCNGMFYVCRDNWSLPAIMRCILHGFLRVGGWGPEQGYVVKSNTGIMVARLIYPAHSPAKLNA